MELLKWKTQIDNIMRYKESITTSRFVLFVFISIALVVQIVRSGKADIETWQNLLPKTGSEIVSFVFLATIVMNTFNWCVIYLVSLFKTNIFLCVDYPFLILSILMFIGVLVWLFIPSKGSGSPFFVLFAGVFSGYNIYQYWLFFKKRKQGQNQDFNWGEK